MSHAERLSERSDGHDDGWSGTADKHGYSTSPFNVLTGVVLSRTQGLTRTTLRMRIGERTDLRVRWQVPPSTQDTVEIGQSVQLTIPAEAIHLETGEFRRGKQRWNRWIGRVVLVNRQSENPVTIVKLHRDTLTLKSLGPVIGSQAPLATWDTVNIVVDPEQVRLTPIGHPYSQAMPSFTSRSLVASHPSSVWLRATVRFVRSSPSGLLVALDVGGVNLFAIIETGLTDMPPWKIGASIEIDVDPLDARIRCFGEGPALPCSVVLSNDIGIRQLSVPVRRANR